MNLLQKLNKIYETIDHLEKRGENTRQNYKYIRAADAVRAIREQFTELKVYAEIDFDFVGAPYTIAREKAPMAPFSAVNVKCVAIFHDLESLETAKGSGLGTGADTGDKAVYKAQTGALKYTLKNSFLVPDEADPEADESVDEGAEPQRSYDPGNQPDFHEARHEAPKPKAAKVEPPAAKPEPAAIPVQTSFAAPEPEPQAAPTPAPGPVDSTMPNEEDMKEYRKLFRKLGNDLSAEGKLKASPQLPAGIKLKVFLLSITGASDPKVITKAQWVDFFQRVDHVKGLEGGMIGLARLVNKANGIEDKKKK